jgi:hypothetical protein
VLQAADALFPAFLVVLMLALIVFVGFNLFRYFDRFENAFGEQLARAAEGGESLKELPARGDS